MSGFIVLLAAISGRAVNATRSAYDDGRGDGGGILDQIREELGGGDGEKMF